LSPFGRQGRPFEHEFQTHVRVFLDIVLRFGYTSHRCSNEQVFDQSDWEVGMKTIRTRAQRPTEVSASVAIAASPQGIRLTRRGRLVLLVLLAVAMITLLGVTRTAVAWAEPSGPTTRTVVVQAGDSLWGIARTVDPQRDPRAVIAEIEELNNLDAAPVVAGQALLVPA